MTSAYLLERQQQKLSGQKEPSNGLRTYTKKRQAVNRVYNALAKQFRENNPVCGIKAPGCTGRTECVHHISGRGKNLTDINTWLPSCGCCNNYVEAHHAWAVEHGFLKSKLGK